MPARVRGGVVNRTGDRVGDALEMRTRRVGVEGFRSAILGVSKAARFALFLGSRCAYL